MAESAVQPLRDNGHIKELLELLSQANVSDKVWKRNAVNPPDIREADKNRIFGGNYGCKCNVPRQRARSAYKNAS